MEKLECVFCQKRFPLDIFSPFCPICHEPLLCSYPSGRRKRFHLEKRLPLDRFLDFLPLKRIDPGLSLGEGDTPLVPLKRVAKKFDLPPLWAKNEALNPSYSFKDRGTAVAIQKAVSLGIEKIGTVSTGNMAASTAAYGARAGLETFVLLKEGTAVSSLLTAGIYGPRLIAVEGDYGALFRKSFSLGRKTGICFLNSVDPFRIEGYKLTGFEVFGQLGNRAPSFIFVPLSSGGHLLGIMRSFEDLKEAGLIRGYPVIVGVQAAGCAPLARALAAGKVSYERVRRVRTIAHAISNPAPPAGRLVLKWIRERGGMIVAVSDGEILAAQRMLAQDEGIFCQPESATTLAGLLKLRKRFRLKRRDRVVLIITGCGLKSLQTLESQKIKLQRADLDHLAEKMT